MKPGEKLFEELLIDGEGVRPTSHKKIRVVASVETDLRRVSESLDELFDHARAYDITALLKSLRTIVPEFVPRYHFEVAPPFAFQRVRPDLFPPQKLAFVRNLRVAGANEGTAA